MGWRSTRQIEQDVWIQDQTTPPFHYYLTREDKADITLTSPATKEDTTVNVSAGHGFTGTGEYIIIQEGDLYFQELVAGVSTNEITLSNPLSASFSTNAVVIRGSIEMNINGSVTPQEFIFWKRGGIPVDIQRARITIWNAAAAGDDGKFGDLTVLTNGVRIKKVNTIDQGLGNYKANSDFREFGGNVEYTSKAGGGGTYAVDVCMQIKESYGIVIRVEPDNPDKIIATVRDNLSTLNRLRIAILGQYTLGE